MGYASFAQYALPKGNAQLNAGLGLGSWGIPVYVGLDYGVHKDISVGGEISFRSYEEKYSGIIYNHSIVAISANGNYHFNYLLGIPNNWDFYAGLNLGFYIWSSPNGYGGGHTSGLDLDLQVGGRYYFNNRVGINLEFGGGAAFSGGKIGLTVKL